MQKIIISILLLVLTVSCDRDYITESEDLQSKSIQNQEEKTNTASLVASNYTEYLVNPTRAVKGTNFFFKVGLSFLANQYTTLSVKFTPPVGNPVYVPMTYNIIDNSYTLSRALILYNDYKYQYVYTSNNTPISGITRTLTVLHPNITLGDDYPYKNSNPDVADQWGFYTKNCTSWVAWKVNQMWGTSTSFKNTMSGVTLSHAKNWASKLAQLGYPVSNTPRAGDIAQWTGSPMSATYGHVAFVNSVDASGNITITQYNYVKHKYSPMTINVGSSLYPHNFIHVQNPL